tara:strand:+ start:1117 stop:1293 length:177 start_codon:yes stop_codon:yes gene_type:complete
MSGDKSNFNYNEFKQGFTGTRFADGTKKRKKPLTEEQARIRREKMNAKYDHNGNLRQK